MPLTRRFASALPIPSVARLQGKPQICGVTTSFSHRRAARTVRLAPLCTVGPSSRSLSHNHMRGQSFSSDSDDRWDSLCRVIQGAGVEMSAGFDDASLERDLTSSCLGYPSYQEFAAHGPGPSRRFFFLQRYRSDLARFRALLGCNLRRCRRRLHNRASTTFRCVGPNHNPRLNHIPPASARNGGNAALLILLQRNARI